MQIHSKRCEEVLNWYFTPLSYFTRTMMQQNRVWDSEVEKLAASAILKTDIYVIVEYNNSNEGSSYGIHQRTIRWCRYNASNSYDSFFAIYIANFRDHHEPVSTVPWCSYNNSLLIENQLKLFN